MPRRVPYGTKRPIRPLGAPNGARQAQPPTHQKLEPERGDMAPERNGIRQCTTPGCKTITRSTRYPAAEHPGTTPRMPGGVCTGCYTGKTIPPCRGCGAPLRMSSTPAKRAPGTKQRKADGLCSPCWVLHAPEKAIPDFKPVTVVEDVTPEKLAHTIKGLEAYMVRRRERMAAW